MPKSRQTPSSHRSSNPDSSRSKKTQGFSSRQQLTSNTTKNRNSSGYLLRKSKKPHAPSGDDVRNVYEFEQPAQRLRRGGSRPSSSRLDSRRTGKRGGDESDGSGGGLDEDEDSDDADHAPTGLMVGGRRVRLIGEHKDDEMIDSEDDEEIDSDAAFEESDEERFAGFSFGKAGGRCQVNPLKSKSTKKPSRLPDVNLAEDSESAASGSSGSEEDEDEDMDGEFLDVLDVLDGKADLSDDENDAAPADKPSLKTPGTQQPSHMEDDLAAMDEDRPLSDGEQDEDEDASASEEDDDEDEDHYISASEEENPLDVDGITALADFVTALPTTTKRKAGDEADGDGGAEPQAKKPRTGRRVLKERTEVGPEGEFRATGGNGPKLTLTDLLTPLAPSSLSKFTKALASSNNSGKPSTALGGAGPLAAPAPLRMKERLDREAAYEVTKGEVNKWDGAIKRIQEAERLVFPLQQESEGKVSNLELAAKFKPTTALESSISSLLTAANLQDPTALSKAEDHALVNTQQLTLEEVAERRGELRKMRELMFRAEIKKKRVAKIKSKTYRKLQRKAKEKLAGALDGDDDGEGGEEDEEAERLKAEVARARERATFKHKNTGKWAKALKRKGEVTTDERREMEEMLERGEKLRRRIQGVGSDEDEEDARGQAGGDDSDEEYQEEDAEGIKRRAFDELALLDSDPASSVDGATRGKGKGKGVFEMKFMKDAMARQMKEADRDMDDFVNEMRGLDDASASGLSGLPHEDSGVNVQRVGGRITLRPGMDTNQRPPPSDTSSVTLKSSDLPPSPSTSSIQIHSPSIPSHTAHKSLLSSDLATQSTSSQSQTENPWLVRSESTLRAAGQRKNEVLVSKGSKALDKSAYRLDKKTKGSEGGVKDAEVDVDMDDVMLVSSKSAETQGASFAATTKGKGKDAQKSQGQKKKGKSGAVDAESDGDDHDSEQEEQERLLEVASLKGKAKANANRVKAFEQRDLVAKAFAGDDVVRDFEAAKKREIAEDAPKEVDTTLQGWGAWGGQGTKKTAPKPHLIKKVKGVDPTSRADHHKSHVIISEKRDKKAAKYMVKDLPYPYTSRAQYERSMEAPMGMEWNTRRGFQKSTAGRVIVKAGTIIEPVTKLH